MPRCYMVKKSLRHESRSPCSPTEACVAPPYHSPDENSAFTETRKAEYAELASLPLSERSAADTEAAHELLSLAHSLPPLQQAPDPAAHPPHHEPAAFLPIYTYTIQPTNIYIVTDEPPKPVCQTFQAVGPCPCPCDFQNEPHVGYITYQAVPPERILGPQPEPHSTTEMDSDPEPQLEIESDTEPEPTTDQGQESDSTLQDTDLASENQSSYTEYESKDLYSEDETKPHGYIESEQTIEYTEMEPSPSRYSENVPYHYSEYVTSSVDYAESEPAQLHYLESESKRPKYSHPDAHRSSESEHEYEQERKAELAEQMSPREALEAQTTNQRWPKKKYDCAQCGKIYATSSNLSRHKQTHRSLDSMMAKRCVECGKVYVSMPALAMHVLTHRMGHVCGICGKQFSRPWLLRGHLRSHTGEKPYSCESCGKAFADRSNLRAHLQTHMPNKKYVCQHCNKTFALKSYLNKHQETTCSRPDDE